MRLGIVIPVLNEEKYIEKCLEAIINHSSILMPEILIVDSGSTDHTLKLASHFPVKILLRKDLQGKKYALLNAGAEKMASKILLFLDADSILPLGYDQEINQILKDPMVIAGAFKLKLWPSDRLMTLISTGNSFRYRLTKIFFGDQGLFISKANFLRAGGYPAEELMEAAYFCRILKKYGKLKLATTHILSSSRRFVEKGVLRMFLMDLFYIILFSLRLPVGKYGKHYWLHNTKTKQ